MLVICDRENRCGVVSDHGQKGPEGEALSAASFSGDKEAGSGQCEEKWLSSVKAAAD